ncbi:hypothetical protein DPMN_097928 [Dreissena polymorpha]|uniref:Uncharacterized protein n=1 Tax=Dreissena polymorpha TaxID=45954 RepID=A0A9D4R504_DREPO|nr:hypothetical protein DPMN_097928 [Dreissena polymorpha]
MLQCLYPAFCAREASSVAAVEFLLSNSVNGNVNSVCHLASPLLQIALRDPSLALAMLDVARSTTDIILSLCKKFKAE